ncbi:MAG: tetratricopeptide repeat protein [Candidatus Electrothrix aestuarii]|uniref:Tetratricopeptide repeat protein n=1 Tax=Candidatus Electrothrix aestuarii TaxID=3062594 RepID=A0AAU8LU62_9BACT|nr:tetratricopeptide repeat protein [Candidatus Electrothrix aestuarii]
MDLLELVKTTFIDLMGQIKAIWDLLPDNPDVIWSGWGIAVVSASLAVIGFVCSKLCACLRKPKAASVSLDASELLDENVLTIDKYKEHLLEQHGNYFLEKQKREEIERKLANLEESYQEKLRLLEESQEKLLLLAGKLPKEQLAEAEERLAQGDTELAEQLFDRVAAEAGQTVAEALLQSGRLAEDRLDYSKALRNYAGAADLAPSNPTYLLAAGIMAWKMGDYQRAKEWLEHLLAIREQEGKEDIELALALNELGLVYEYQGCYKKAEPIYKRALEVAEKTLGKEHLHVAAVLNNLARLYVTQSRYEKAVPLYQRSLVIKENKLGKDHPYVTNTLGNLANLYRVQGRYDEAEPLYNSSLKIREEKLGKKHPDVANSLDSIALLYCEQGRYNRAEPLYKRSLEISEETLGKDHPNVAVTLNNLAELYRKQRRYEEADPLYKQSLEISEKALGKDHPSVATTLNNLASLYESQGRYGEAKSLYKRSLEIFEKKLGKDHPSTATILNNLAGLYRTQNRYEKAEPLYLRALAILNAKFPNGHPDIGMIQENYKKMKEMMKAQWAGQLPFPPQATPGLPGKATDTVTE